MKRKVAMVIVLLHFLSVPLQSLGIVNAQAIKESHTNQRQESITQRPTIKLLNDQGWDLMNAKKKILFLAEAALSSGDMTKELRKLMTDSLEKNIGLVGDEISLSQLQHLLNDYFSGNREKLSEMSNSYEVKRQSDMMSETKDPSESQHNSPFINEETSSEDLIEMTDQSSLESSSSTPSLASERGTNQKIVDKNPDAEIEKNESVLTDSSTKNTEVATQAVIASAPKGLSIDGVLAGGLGNARHIKRESDETDVVIITDAEQAGGRGQTGGIWSNEKMRIDLKKPFQADVAMYFGSTGLAAADGMTFTLHNDPRGTRAIGDGGGALGAYGPIDDRKNFHQKAIQNAFSIEFDTHKNDRFDNPSHLTDQHISAAYPHVNTVEKAKTWSANGAKEKVSQFGNYFSNVIFYHHRLWAGSPDFFRSSSDNFLSDGRWHDLKITYTPQTNGDFGSFLLSFDGKVANLSQEFLAKNLGFDLNNPNKDAFVYWGFTGATGAKGSTSAVVFREIPGLMVADYKADITQDGQSITNQSPLTKVTHQSELTYHAELSYLEGKQSMLSPTISSTVSDSVRYIPGSYEVSLNDEAYQPVSDSELKLSAKEVTYQLEKDLSLKAEEIASVKTRFKVKTTDVYDQDAIVSEKVSFTGKNAAYVTDDNSLAYQIKKIDHDGRLTLLELDDNQDEPSNANQLSGEVVMRPGVGHDKGGTIHFSGDPAIEGDRLAVKLNNEGAVTFNYPLPKGRFLTATNTVTATFMLDGQISAIDQQVVQDKYAPTGQPVSLDYFVHKQSEDLSPPISANAFVKSVKDTNPTVATKDIEIAYENPKQVLADMTKPGDYEVKIVLTDPVGNQRIVTSQLKIHPSRLMLSAKDVTYPIEEVVDKDSDGKLQFKDKKELLQLLVTNQELEAFYLTNDGQKINVVDQIKVTDHDLQTKAGTYSVTLRVSDEGMTNKGRVPTITTETSFQVTITDGVLTYHVTNDMSLQSKLQTTSKNLPFDKPFKVHVKNTQFGSGQWRLTAKAGQFIDQEQNLLPMSLEYIRDGQVNDLTNKEQLIMTSKATDQTISLDAIDSKEQYFNVSVAEDSINWASKGTKSTTKIDWNLANSDEGIINSAEKLTLRSKPIK